MYNSINNKKLNKEFIETIAGQWKRLNIETVKEAMDICRKEHKKIIKNKPVLKTKKTEDIKTPEWFGKDVSVNHENSSELEELLKDFQ